MDAGVGSLGRILHDSASHFYWSGKGSTSLKSFYNGRAVYQLTNGRRLVDANRYLLLNDDEPYTISIDAKQEVESFCVFFAPGYAYRVAYDLTNAANGFWTILFMRSQTRWSL